MNRKYTRKFMISLRPLTVVPGPNIAAVQWSSGWTGRDHWTAGILGPETTVYSLKLVYDENSIANITLENR